ncbi:MAG: chromosomal replication initiator protein DnaA [Bacteroidales bacterium]|nr:chromosomal replication initiator protein DnaA [Bacteroidales bacterium]MCM1147863.1 chromosomal replication initiator protein DnaA [Bacteroidales bacterium]MCM1206706.1 chromosomal replication initiator protein DnaA [Bacillota bacterium]MCM1510902.1 chromosomal replication initiator protein DnaA [Clostridium sp.]
MKGTIVADYKQLWKDTLRRIQADLAAEGKEEEFGKWFQPVTFESFDMHTHQLLLRVPGRAYIDQIEKNHLRVFAKALIAAYGKGVKLNYRIVVVKEDNETVVEASDPEIVAPRGNASQKQSKLPEVDPQLTPSLNFKNFIEGESNKLSRSVGLNIAEHPRSSKFNPFFIFGPSGCGKTHLITAIGLRAKELYPNLRVLYVSARTFRQQYTSAVTDNKVNDFIAFYQTLDMLIVDDIQEWASQEKTQDTFFHIFDYLFRRGKRIILASDRSPAQLRGMHERLITRFVCGATCELMKPNMQLCVDILKNKIVHDGLVPLFPEEVIMYIATTVVNSSVRDLQGIINSLMVYSIAGSTEIDLPLAEKVIKRIVAFTDDTPVTLDNIVDSVCLVCSVTPQDINSKSRKKDITEARQIVMYLAQTLTNMPATRIGRLVGGRDHSTVAHSCRKIKVALEKDKQLRQLVGKIKKEIKAATAK